MNVLKDEQLLELFNHFFRSCRLYSVESPSLSSLLEPKSGDDKNGEPPQRCPFMASVLNVAATWGWSAGITMLQDGNSTLSARLAPFTLLPSPVPRNCFNQAIELSPIFTRMTVNMTLNAEWLYKSLQRVGELDPSFTRRLLDIAKSTYGPNPNQRNIEEDIKLILIRSDYMFDYCDGIANLKQVELNTISLSFGGLAESLTNLHRLTTGMVAGTFLSKDMIPPNRCGKNLSEALRQAHNVYVARHSTVSLTEDILGTCLLFIVRDTERNEIDQRKLEYALAEDGPNGEAPVPVKRLTLEQLTSGFFEMKTAGGIPLVHYRKADPSGKLIPMTSQKSEKARLFIYDLNCKGFWDVSLVYFRAGYDPSDFDLDVDRYWSMREVLERSEAVKCPNILTHLSGTKKIQCLWGNEEELSVCLPNLEDLTKISKTFVDQVDPNEFSHPKVMELIKEAIETPELFILKPQREGGLHNFHGSDIASILTNIINKKPIAEGTQEGSSFILMRKIQPVPLLSATLDKPSLGDFSVQGTPWAQPRPIVRSCLSELGTFGVYLADGKKEILNMHGGHLLRTKDARMKEGGVATGAAFLDSPLLLDERLWTNKTLLLSE